MTSLSILVADDHPVVRSGVRSLLEANQGWQVVAEAGNGREAVAKAKQFRPNIVILDLSMPRLGGLDATRLILNDRPDMRILILTMHSAQELIRRTLQAGARGYVLKSDAGRDLIAAVDALRANRTFFSSVASETLLSHIGGWGKDGSPIPTARENEIIQLLAEGRSNKEVADMLGISKRTAETHRAHIMNKLGLRSLSDLVRYAIRNHIVQA